MRTEQRTSRRILRRAIYQIVRAVFAVRRTLRFENDLDLESPCIVAAFHENTLPVLRCLEGRSAVLLTSDNHVGGSAAKVIEAWGFEIVYGSRRASGDEAFKVLAHRLAEGRIVVITPDGSRGPRREMKPGAVLLALKSGVPLYLVNAKYRGIRLRPTWDKFLWPLPFARVEFRVARMDITRPLGKGGLKQKIAEAENLLLGLYDT